MMTTNVAPELGAPSPGLGTNRVSIVFAVIVVGLVAYLTKSKADVTEVVHRDEDPHSQPRPHHVGEDARSGALPQEG